MPRPRGRSPIGAMRRVVDAGGDEALELLPALVEHAHGRIARAGHLARDVEELPQDRLDVELGDQKPSPRIDQATEAGLVEGGLRHLGDASGLYGKLRSASGERFPGEDYGAPMVD